MSTSNLATCNTIKEIHAKNRKHHSNHLNIIDIEFQIIHEHYKSEAPDRNAIDHIYLEKIRKFSIKIEELKFGRDVHKIKFKKKKK